MINFGILDFLAKRKALDYIGVNFYSRNLIETEGWTVEELLTRVCRKKHNNLEKNSLGWEIYPVGIYKILVWLKKYNLPVFILENGICTEDDSQRWAFIRQHLEYVHKAIQEGTKVIGYIHWALMDNFEWDKGFSPRFGLVGIDYKTYQRVVKESASKLSEVFKNNILET
jgi:beta-glucosidase